MMTRKLDARKERQRGHTRKWAPMKVSVFLYVQYTIQYTYIVYILYTLYTIHVQNTAHSGLCVHTVHCSCAHCLHFFHTDAVCVFVCLCCMTFLQCAFSNVQSSSEESLCSVCCTAWEFPASNARGPEATHCWVSWGRSTSVSAKFKVTLKPT